MIRATLVLLTLLAPGIAPAAPPDRGPERQRLEAVAQPLIDHGHLRSAVIGLLDASGPPVYASRRPTAPPRPRPPPRTPPPPTGTPSTRSPRSRRPSPPPCSPRWRSATKSPSTTSSPSTSPT